MNCLFPNAWRGFALLLAVSSSVAHAADGAGKVLFAHGGVSVERGGAVIGLAVGAPLQEGDVVRTESNGFLQLRMTDGALMAVRANSQLSLDAYRAAKQHREAELAPAAVLPNIFGSTAASPSPSPSPSLAVVQAAPPEESSVARVAMRLLKGGFRSITGAIGHINREEYVVRVSSVTIGIRGTDYTSLLCADDCTNLKNGLHLRVSSGAVALVSEAGLETLVRQGEYAFFGPDMQRPEIRLTAPDELTVEAPSDSGTLEEASYDSALASAPADGGDESSQRASATPLAQGQAGVGGSVTPAQTNEPLVVAPPREGRSLAFAQSRSSDNNVRSGGIGLGLDANGDLNRISDGDSSYLRTGTASRDFGQDDATALRWGRWAGGTVQVGAAAPRAFDNLHWVLADDDVSTIVLPRTGRASYQLVGNTAPTSSSGQVGFVGSATLNANFSAATLSTSVSLGIGNNAIQASGTAPLAAAFSGSYNAISVNGVAQAGGSGSFAGFFTGNRAGAAPAGAGLTYGINAAGVNAQGALAFGNPATAP